jgi:hypothetical protein
MNSAFVDITLETSGDLFHLWIGTENLLKAIQCSPLGDEYVRLLLSGDGLPDTYSEKAKRAKLCYQGSLTGANLNIFDE